MSPRPPSRRSTRSCWAGWRRSPPSPSPTTSTGATARPRSTTGSARSSSTPGPSSGSRTPSARTRYLALVGSRRRRARRGPHVHLLRARAATPGPTNNWRDPAEMRETLDGLFDGAMRGPHDVRRARSRWARWARTSRHVGVQLTDSAYVAVSMRIMTRMGAGRARRRSATTASSCPACTRSARRWPTARRTCRGRATPRTSTSSTSPRRARSGPTARATAATRCWARSASRCGSPRSWRATRAGWPSTC